MELWDPCYHPPCDMPGYGKETHIFICIQTRQPYPVRQTQWSVAQDIAYFLLHSFLCVCFFFTYNDVVACVSLCMFTDTCLLRHTAPGHLPSLQMQEVTKHDC